MSTETKNALFHTLLAFLLAAGIALPLCFSLQFEHYWPVVLLVSFLVPAGLSMVSGHKKITLVILGVFLASQLISAFALPYGGPIISSIVSTGKALLLFARGQKDALPIFALDFTVIITLIIAFFSYFLSKKDNSFIPALSVLLFSMLSLWFMGRGNYIFLTLPAVVAVIMLYLRQTHEDLHVWRVLPIIIVIALLSFFILPMEKTTLPPLENAANKIRETVSDYLFFTQTRTIFSLEDEGYHMGGPAEPSDELVLKVTTPEKVYLRGTIKNEYTGLSWRDTTGGKRHLYHSPRWSALKEKTFNGALPSKSIINDFDWLDYTFPVSVQMITTSPSSLFLSQRFEELTLSSGLVPYFNVGSEIFITRNLFPQDYYGFKGKSYLSSQGDLTPIIKVLETGYDPNYAEMIDTYTLLPSHMESEEVLYRLVNSITQDLSSGYEKAIALENHLKRYYAYTLTPEPVPENLDFVSYFIQIGKEGYCTYFASAMTVMARMANLPARYVEGFVAVPDENGVAYLSGKNAHAWTEIYFPNFGWVTFDATPGETPPSSPPPRSPESPDGEEEPPPESNPTPEPEDATPPETDEPDDTPPPPPDEPPTPEDEEPNVEPDKDENPPSVFWLLLILAIVLALAGVVLRVRYVMPGNQAKRAKDEEALFFTWVQAIYDVLRLDKLSPYANETPTAFALRCNYTVDYPLSLAPMAQVLSYVSYGPHPVEEPLIVIVKDTFDSLYLKMPWHKKLRFVFTRAFWPKKNQNLHLPKAKKTSSLKNTKKSPDKEMKKPLAKNKKVIPGKGKKKTFSKNKKK